MTLNSIRLVNFRSYKDASFEFDKGVNIIVGPNASGKTNLLESVLVICWGKSYRVTDKDLISYGEPWLRLECLIDDNSRRVMKLTNLGEKTTDVNGKIYKRLTKNQELPVVLFEPNHLMLLHGQPEARRNYLDDILDYYDPEFYSARRHYKRVLLQRNNLLKTNPRDINSQIFVWNVRLSELGGYVANRRDELIEKINENIGDVYSKIAGKKTEVEIRYKTNVSISNYETTMLKRLEEELDKDLTRGFTGCGPHRDDFEVLINGKEVLDSASRGETRTALLSLKVNEIEIMKEKYGTSPIILLDDVFSELDGSRRHALTTFISNYQVFITTTDADVISHDFAQKANLIAL